MEKNKKTLKEMYEEIIANETLTEEQREFLKSRVELLDKKKGSTNAKKSDEHIEIENQIIATFEKEPNRLFSCSEIALALNLSPQKITPRLKALVADEKITVSKDKRANVYKLAVVGE